MTLRILFALLVALPASAQTATVCEIMLTDQYRERIAADRSLELEAVPLKSVYVSQADWVTISMALGGFIQIHGIADRQVGFAPGEWASFDCRPVSGP